MRRPPRKIVLTWGGLLLLLAANLGLAYAPLGWAHIPVSIGIAVLMAALVLIVFMELDRRFSLFWIFAGAGFFWLAILFGMTAADYLTRYNAVRY